MYTIRLRTSESRGASLSEPHAGVLVCLLAQDGRATLHRISPFVDLSHRSADLQELCADLDDEARVDCRLGPALLAAAEEQEAMQQAASSSPSTPSSSPSSSSSPSLLGGLLNSPKPSQSTPRLQHRFQQGATDEVSFAAPELGPLAAIWLAPEQGEWSLDEVVIRSSRTGHVDRFINRGDKIGGKSRNALPAVQLLPVSADAVLYGDRSLSPTQASALKIANSTDYDHLKRTLSMTTMVLVLLGAGVAQATSGTALALMFLLGGVGGVTYQWLLAAQVDAIGGMSESPRSLTSSPLLRLALLGAWVVVVVAVGRNLPSESEFFGNWVAALIGFLQYKISAVMIGTTMHGNEAEQALLATWDRVERGEEVVGKREDGGERRSHPRTK